MQMLQSTVHMQRTHSGSAICRAETPGRNLDAGKQRGGVRLGSGERDVGKVEIRGTKANCLVWY